VNLEVNEMKSKLGIALLGILVFLLGGIAGAVSHYLCVREQLKLAALAAEREAARKRPPNPNAFLDRIATEFNLDSLQKESLRDILKQSRARQRQLGLQVKPSFDAIIKDTEEQIKKIMRPDQRAKYEAFLKDWYSKQSRSSQAQAGPPQAQSDKPK
jgi:hypothetical protein